MLQPIPMSGIFDTTNLSCTAIYRRPADARSASDANPIEIPSVAVGLSHVDPIMIVRYPMDIPQAGWDFRWGLMGSRLVCPLEHGINSKWRF